MEKEAKQPLFAGGAQAEKSSSPYISPFIRKVLPGLGALKDAIDQKDATPYVNFLKETNARLSSREGMIETTLGFTPIGRLTAGTSPIVRGAKDKLINAVRGATQARAPLETAQTAERSARAAQVEKVFSKPEGEAGYKKALGTLKGELVPEKPAIKIEKLERADIDELFNTIQTHGTLDVYEKISASNGLANLLEGKLPPRSQLGLLEDVFGKELAEAVLKQRPLLSKIRDAVTEIANIPRSLITSIDFSAPLRQGVIFTVTRPRSSSKALVEGVRQALSKDRFETWLKEIPNHPYYPVMKRSGLYISDPTKVSGGLSAKEERFMSNFATKYIPWVRVSERGYVGYLNKLRVDVFEKFTKKFMDAGLDPVKDAQAFKSLANFVNTFTGRGGLGRLEAVAQELNTVFFSPRLIAARFNALNPVWYAQQSPAVRKEAIKSFAEFIGVGVTMLSLLKLNGFNVETDLRSTDSGKIRVGNTRWDIWGGFQQWVRVFSQMATGERKTTKGEIQELSKKEFPFTTRLDVAGRFLRGKLAPVPSLVAEIMEGASFMGEDLSLKQELVEASIPLFLQDMQSAIREMGPQAIFTVGVPGFFGVGVQNYRQSKLPSP